VFDGSDDPFRHDAERRRWERVAVDATGELIVGQQRISCTILDMSIGGVRVSIPATTILPEQVTFTMEGSPPVLAYCRWTRGHDVGLELLGPVSETGEADGAVTPDRGPVENVPSREGERQTAMYAAVSPRGYILRSTMSLTPDAARNALGATSTQLASLESLGWRIVRFSCSIPYLGQLTPGDSSSDKIDEA
jgi:hypothetical protein